MNQFLQKIKFYQLGGKGVPTANYLWSQTALFRSGF